MKRRGRIIVLALTFTFCCVTFIQSGVAALSAEPAAPLRFQQLKISGDEYLVLQATADISHLSEFWLGYVSTDSQVPPPTQQLPDVPLAAGDSILITDGGSLEICGVRYITNLGPTLADTKGSLALWQMTATSFTRLTGTQTSVVWAKSTKSSPIDMQTHDIDILAEASLANPAWFYDASSLSWRAGSISAGCRLTIPSADTTEDTIVYEWGDSGAEPPATIESVIEEMSGTTISVPTIPVADIGLAPPRITELLANPEGTGDEDTDEFIELYNPNAKAFDLSGFVLQTGLTTKHSYTFPAGTILPATSFKAFYSGETGLSLSNTGSQANLNDPLGTTIAQTDPFASAKDGQAWALANGTWYWTVKPTPSAANVIAAPIVTTKNGLKKVTTKKKSSKTTAVKGATTTKATDTTATVAAVNSASTSPAVHTGLLAVVGVAAVGYVLYEYRQDVANAIDKLRRNRGVRR